MPADVWDGTTCDVLERARLAAMSLSLLCVISVGGGGRPPAGVRRGTAPGPASMYAVDKFEKLTTLLFSPSPLSLSRVAAARTTGERAGAVATPSTTLASTGPLKSQPRCGLPDVTLIRVSGPSISLSVARVSGLGGLDSHWALCSRSPVLSFLVQYRFVHSQLRRQLLKHIHKDPTDSHSPGASA